MLAFQFPLNSISFLFCILYSCSGRKLIILFRCSGRVIMLFLFDLCGLLASFMVTCRF